MSLVARIALGVAVLAVLAVGGVIFYVLPQLSATVENSISSSATSTAAPAASPIQAAEPPPAPVAQTPPPAVDIGSGAPYSGAPSPPAPVPVAAAPPEPAPAPQPAPADSAAAPNPVAPATSPAAPPASPSAGAPIPLAPAPGPAPAVAQAPLDPANPGPDNIAFVVDRTLPMGGTADARAAPQANATVVTRLNDGTPVRVMAVLAGSLWLKVELADQRVAFIPTAAIPSATSLGPASPPTAGSAPAAPAESAAPSFISASATLTTTAATPVYPAPSADGPPLRILKPGTAVQIIAKTQDGQWGWLQTPDNQQAFVQMATLSAAPPKPPELPEAVYGHAQVVNTATLIVDGQRLQLFGLRGEGAPYTAQLKSLIDSSGGVVSCHRRGTQYLCTLPGNLDIGRMALFNGAARPAGNASPDYQEQAASAREGHRGVWR